jgi:hypothetical protein
MAVRRMQPSLYKTFDSVNPSGSPAGFPVFTIVLSGAVSFEQYTAIKKALEDVRGVRSVEICKLSPGEIALEVVFAGDPKNLIAEILKQKFDGFTIKEEGSKDDVYRLVVK